MVFEAWPAAIHDERGLQGNDQSNSQFSRHIITLEIHGGQRQAVYSLHDDVIELTEGLRFVVERYRFIVILTICQNATEGLTVDVQDRHRNLIQRVLR